MLDFRAGIALKVIGSTHSSSDGVLSYPTLPTPNYREKMDGDGIKKDFYFAKVVGISRL